MKIADRRCLVCDCEGTMRLDARAIARALGAGTEPVIHHQLCRSQLDRYRAALETGEPLLVACTQEAPLFGELAAEDHKPVLFTNIRERAGWSADGEQAAAKIAALLAEAVVPSPPAPTLTLRSEGRCLVYGDAETALDAARALSGRLATTLLLRPGADALPPSVNGFPVLQGQLRRLSGHLGAFRAEVEGLASPSPSSRQHLRFGAPAREPAVLEADLVLDLSGSTPLLTAHHKRDGYLRPDPRDPAAVARALLETTELVGEFEKPRYIHFSAELCAHSRSRRTGCTRCLDLCPTGAITPAGDHVAIDPFTCAGCGACAGVCPTGAAAYASPGANALLQRLSALLGTYLRAGGSAPVLLVHETGHGDELIAFSARLGRGLPANVLPFGVSELAQLGLETLAGAFAYGASQVLLLVSPRKQEEMRGLFANLGYLAALLEQLGYDASQLGELATNDPDELEDRLWSPGHRPSMPAATYLPMGGNRALMRLALDHLHAHAPAPVELVPLPTGAPFGSVVLDQEGCTLCLACVGACPTGALLDNPDRPMLRFLEDACVQCGLCQNTCPERVIRLEPRLSFLAEARSPRVLKEEEPATCIRCGKAFGTRSTIERVVSRLAERHSMFQTRAQVDLIRMCDDCRVIAQVERRDNPMVFGERPRTRMSEDYLRARSEVPGGDG
jgi:ferredoxin